MGAPNAAGALPTKLDLSAAACRGRFYPTIASPRAAVAMTELNSCRMTLASSIPARRSLCRAALLAALLFASATSYGGEIQHGTVVKIRDGDTLQLETETGRRIEVRLNAIDAPERSSENMRSQPFAQSARIHLAQLTARRRATLQHHTMDRYGRYVGVLHVQTPDGLVDAGLWQVEAGMAWVHTRYLPELPVRLRQRYRDAEHLARTERRGLWHDPNPIAPWDWRQRHQRPAPSPPKRGAREAPVPAAAIESYFAARSVSAVSVCMVSRAKQRSAQDFALSGSVRSR